MIRWGFILRALCGKFPGWVITGLILVVGCGLFLIWRMSFHSGRSTPIAKVPAIDTDALAEDFEAGRMILCGNSLVNLGTGAVTQKWLEGFSDAPPTIARILPREKLVICANRGHAAAFGFDGKAKAPVSLDGEAIGAAAYRAGYSEVLFVRGGNLLVGHVDWIHSTVNDAKRLTEVGYFRDDLFHGQWFWYDDTVLVSILGRTHRVDLASGAVSQEALSVGQINHGVSPDGRMAAIAGGPGFAVINFDTGETKQFSVRGRFREFLWLGDGRLAYVSDRNELSVLNVATAQATAFATPPAALKIVAASPGGENLMVAAGTGPMVFSTKDGRFVPVDLPIDDGAWISDHLLICSSSSSDTTFRGIWVVDLAGQKENITNQPADSMHAAAGAKSVISVPGGAVWVSGGNLWRYDFEAKVLSQVTFGEKLIPILQASRSEVEP